MFSKNQVKVSKSPLYVKYVLQKSKHNSVCSRNFITMSFTEPEKKVHEVGDLTLVKELVSSIV